MRVCLITLQVKKGREQITQARKDVRQAVVRQAEVVACTLSAAGGDLPALIAAGPLFDMVVIDEVRPLTLSLLSSLWHAYPRFVLHQASLAGMYRAECTDAT